MPTLEFEKIIVSTLEDHKAIDVISLDVRGFASIMQSLVVCSALSRRHASALADHLQEKLRENHRKPLGIEGKKADESEWVLLDYGDVVIHILLPEVRELYQLEKLWKKPL